MNKPPEGGTRDARGVIVSMTTQEQQDWSNWVNSLDPTNEEDRPYIQIFAIGTDLFNLLKEMERKVLGHRKLQNGCAQ